MRMKQPAKKSSKTQTSSKKSKLDDSLLKTFEECRLETASNIIEFEFNKKRVRMLNDVKMISEERNGIAYWMSRDQRVQDNWALLFAQKLGIKNHFPLHVIFCMNENLIGPTLRQFKFMIDGLKEVAEDLKALNINFHLAHGDPTQDIPKFVEDFNVGCLVCDFYPIRIYREWIDKIKEKLPENVSMVQVDAHNIVPVWMASDKQEYSARTIRDKINRKLDEFLTEFPPLIEHPFKSETENVEIDWNEIESQENIDGSVKEIDWAVPGYRGSLATLNSFIQDRLQHYDGNRNDPNQRIFTNLSPFLCFGQISTQRVVLEVQKYEDKFSKAVEEFLDDTIIRRELSDNFCFYNENYDNFKGFPDWAQKTLNDHRKDKREFVYTLKELDEAHTHDDMFNATQLQLKNEGRINHYLRMYWNKKILEWTKGPEEAFEFALHLNDRYNFDGKDPNSFVRCAWSIGGLHDQSWGERAIFGKVRWMSYDGIRKKFDLPEFVEKYGAKVYKKKK